MYSTIHTRLYAALSVALSTFFGDKRGGRAGRHSGGVIHKSATGAAVASASRKSALFTAVSFSSMFLQEFLSCRRLRGGRQPAVCIAIFGEIARVIHRVIHSRLSRQNDAHKKAVRLRAEPPLLVRNFSARAGCRPRRVLRPAVAGCVCAPWPRPPGGCLQSAPGWQ